MRRLVCAAMFLGCGVLQAQTVAALPQFEVASIKPTATAQTGMSSMSREIMRDRPKAGMIPMAGPDRVRIRNWALLDLIAVAYGVRTTQVSGPDWLGDQGFDVDATVAQGAPKEQLDGMLQSLLEERFGLKAHRATQTAQGFALVVGKDGAKLKPGEPTPPAPNQQLTAEERQAAMQQKLQANLKRLQERSAALGASSSQSWVSVTMADLAAQLYRFAGAPVVDETGLSGKYSVKIETWANPDVPGGTIFDAVEKLGLKLQPQKVAVDRIVVDQVAKMPTAN